MLHPPPPLAAALYHKHMQPSADPDRHDRGLLQAVFDTLLLLFLLFLPTPPGPIFHYCAKLPHWSTTF